MPIFRASDEKCKAVAGDREMGAGLCYDDAFQCAFSSSAQVSKMQQQPPADHPADNPKRHRKQVKLRPHAALS